MHEAKNVECTFDEVTIFAGSIPRAALPTVLHSKLSMRCPYLTSYPEQRTVKARRHCLQRPVKDILRRLCKPHTCLLTKPLRFLLTRPT